MSTTDRGRFYAFNVLRLAGNSGAAAEMGPEAFALVVQVGLKWDAIKYSRPVAFWNAQLCELLGFSPSRLNRARQKACAAGWLHYESGRRSQPGLYYVTVPGELGDEPGDPPAHEPDGGDGGGDDGEFPTASDQETEFSTAFLPLSWSPAVPFLPSYRLTFSPPKPPPSVEQAQTPDELWAAWRRLALVSDQQSDAYLAVCQAEGWTLAEQRAAMLDRQANPRRRIWRRGPTPEPIPARPDRQARRDAIIYWLARDAKQAGLSRSWIQERIYNPRDTMSNEQLRQVRADIARHGAIHAQTKTA